MWTKYALFYLHSISRSVKILTKTVSNPMSLSLPRVSPRSSRFSNLFWADAPSIPTATTALENTKAIDTCKPQARIAAIGLRLGNPIWLSPTSRVRKAFSARMAAPRMLTEWATFAAQTMWRWNMSRGLVSQTKGHHGEGWSCHSFHSPFLYYTTYFHVSPSN